MTFSDNVSISYLMCTLEFWNLQRNQTTELSGYDIAPFDTFYC